VDDADEPVPVALAPRTLKFLELAVEFDTLQRLYQAEVPTACAWQQQSGPEALISGVNAALVSLRSIHHAGLGDVCVELLDPTRHGSHGHAFCRASVL
jgi:hypothetical protein